MKMKRRPEWMFSALCSWTGQPEWWDSRLPDATSRTEFNAHMTHQSWAKEICEQCPVRQECLEHALEHSEFGIWGGLDDHERNRIAKRRGAKPNYRVSYQI